MGTAAREYDMTTRTATMGRTRSRLILAARDRFSARRYDEVTLADLAGSAGVSVQTLLNHFGSKEGLLTAAIELLADEVADLRGAVEPGDLDGAIDSLTRHYEMLGDANWRFVADAEGQHGLAGFIAGARAGHRAWLESVFGPHLPVDDAARDETIAALYAVTDVGTWKLLRRDLGRTPDETRAVLRRLIVGVLEKE